MNEFKPIKRLANQVCIRRASAVALSLAVLLAGVLYYALYRQHALPSVLQWLPVLVRSDVPLIPHGLFGQSVPSLTHAFATVLLLHALLPASLNVRLPMRLVVVACLIFFELVMGTPDFADLMAILLGALMAELLAWRLGLVSYARQRTGKWALVGLVSMSGLMAAGTQILDDSYGYTECAIYDESGVCEEYKKPAAPIYMSYVQLRDAVSVQPARAPDQLGRIYLYQDYIFLNEHNQGIHIIDNQNPEIPVNIGFIRIPGNTEVNIRDNYLYADSYIDLVTLDLNDPANVQLVSRQEDIFPYDEFQSIPYNISFQNHTIDRQRGVIVGYRLTDN